MILVVKIVIKLLPTGIIRRDILKVDTASIQWFKKYWILNLRKPVTSVTIESSHVFQPSLVLLTPENDSEGGRHPIPETGPRGQRFGCDECGKKFKNSFNLKRHTRSYHDIKETISPHSFFKKSFSDKFMMVKHKQSCYLQCQWSSCELRFTRQKLFKQHQNAHESKMRRVL
jgi:uncharacterized Zn-finger protein